MTPVRALAVKCILREAVRQVELSSRLRLVNHLRPAAVVKSETWEVPFRLRNREWKTENKRDWVIFKIIARYIPDLLSWIVDLFENIRALC